MNVNKLDEKFLESTGFKYDKYLNSWMSDSFERLIENLERKSVNQELFPLLSLEQLKEIQTIQVSVNLNEEKPSITVFSISPDNALNIYSRIGILYIEQLLMACNFFRNYDKTEITENFLRSKFEFEDKERGIFSNNKGEYSFGLGRMIILRSDNFSCLLQEFNYVWQYEKIDKILNYI